MLDTTNELIQIRRYDLSSNSRGHEVKHDAILRDIKELTQTRE